MTKPLTPPELSEPPADWLISVGRILALGLFLFDLILGGLATIWPEVYAALFHPNRDHAQLEFIRRMGGLWLTFSAIAFVAAAARPTSRARWFFVLGWLRLIEAPADTLYALTATGTTELSRWALLLSVPLNLAMGGYLYWLSRKMIRSRWGQARGDSPRGHT